MTISVSNEKQEQKLQLIDIVSDPHEADLQDYGICYNKEFEGIPPLNTILVQGEYTRAFCTRDCY